MMSRHWQISPQGKIMIAWLKGYALIYPLAYQPFANRFINISPASKSNVLPEPQAQKELCNFIRFFLKSNAMAKNRAYQSNA
jgi:hypothetical protein